MKTRFWQTSRRRLLLERPLVMGILNVTPDSFSDGGEFLSVDDALRRAEEMIAEGADIIDIGGESTRPGSTQVDVETEVCRTSSVIEAIAKRFDTPISVDTSKSQVARAAIDNGAEIINDISGLRWDPGIAAVAATSKAGLILMHSRGDFATMHFQPVVANIMADVTRGFQQALTIAREHGIADAQIALDIGIGFGKAPEQNLELIAKLDTIAFEFENFPIVVGASRKSFIGKIISEMSPGERLSGSLAAAAIAVYKGSRVVRVHDVKETVSAVKVVAAMLEKG